MKRMIFVAALSVMLTACSGGGGGSAAGASGGSTASAANPIAASDTTNTTSTSAAMPPVGAQKLDATIGTWAADCSDHEIEYATITRVSEDTVKVSSKVDYYAGAGCTGPVIGTQTDTGDFPARYAGNTDATIALPPSTTADVIRADMVTMTVPAYSVTVAGTGVTRLTKDGVPQWCMDFDDGSTTCVVDDGTHNGTTSNGALYVQDNQLFVLSANEAGFSVDQRMTRK
jgi:hypothetical protein